MPPPQPKTPQSNTLLNYFNRTVTPKSQSSNGDGSNSNASGGGNRASGEANSEVVSSPSTNKSQKGPNNGKSGISPGLTTPKSSDPQRKKRRRPSSGVSGDAEDKRKRLRADSPGGEFKDGSIVWAKLEGFPWWTAMVRGEILGGPFSRRNGSEFHVQFFDDPPSRAWIRKIDLKLYEGSQDGKVPPSKADPTWVEACKAADGALLISPKKRIEKYWVDFDLDGNGSEGSNSNSETENSVMTTPKTKSSSRNGNKKERKRLKVIESSEEDADESMDDTRPTDKKSNGRGKRNKLRSPESDVDYENSTEFVNDASESEDSQSAESEIEISTPDEDSDGEAKSRSKKLSIKRNGKSLATPNSTIKMESKSTIKARLSQFTPSSVDRSPSNSNAQPQATSTNTAIFDRSEQWTKSHLKMEFLQPHRIMDNHKRRPSDPNYDPRTLFIPTSFLDQLTPATRQWWVMKAKNFDTLLFFKLGKFYEFYHMDAVIAAEVLQIQYMKGDIAHVGFPESAFSKNASALIEKGYKIARVEQTETPDMMNERLKKGRSTKFDKVVKREICQISTRGVRYASFQDDEYRNPFSPESVFLYGIVEKVSATGPSEFGVCFVDTTIGNFHIGQFFDDRHCSRLRTLFSHHTPAQILFERGKVSAATMQILNNYTAVRKDGLVPESEFWGPSKLLKYLSEENIFVDKESGDLIWPETFKNLLAPGDNLGFTPDEKWDLGLKGLGGVVYYLKYCLLDNDLLTLKKFSVYEPVDVLTSNPSPIPNELKQSRPKFMVLDGITLSNLDITEGQKNLLSFIDRCCTPFGKRLLRHWVCMPLAIPEEISERLDAVHDLMSLNELTDKLVPMLKSLPDLERLLNKVHYLGSVHRSKDHPDGRAFFFDEIKYSKRKIHDLFSILKGFKTCNKIIGELKESISEIKSKLLLTLFTDFPFLDRLLDHFDTAFDHNAASKDGKIIPKEGVVVEFDDASNAVQQVEMEAAAYLKEVSRELQTRVIYFGSDKKRFQLEVAEATRMPNSYEFSSSKKGYKRYVNAKTKKLLSSIMQAETVREEVLRDIARRIFEKFDSNRDVWQSGVECIAKLDALLSLAAFSSSQEDMCRPNVVYSSPPFINIKQGRHPCMPTDSYMPNSCNLGSRISSNSGDEDGIFILLTGPNMGGKSTLMRQVGLLTVLAHLGCYVPATECEMSVVDRIFTRLGANDNIGEGESTFFVEMSETSAILKHSTPHSLILMDELGRGTATYDGTAIAYAVSTELASRGSRTIFSTHYHTLVDAIEHFPSVQLGHMACMVENENEDDPTQETITFLYKLAPGACPKSYGFNAARLAGIPDDVIRVAHRKAKDFEASVNKVDLFRKFAGEKKLSISSAKEFGIEFH